MEIKQPTMLILQAQGEELQLLDKASHQLISKIRLFTMWLLFQTTSVLGKKKHIILTTTPWFSTLAVTKIKEVELTVELQEEISILIIK